MSEERWLLSFIVTPAGQSRAFLVQAEFSRLSDAERHRMRLAAEPECSNITLIRLTDPAPPRCGLCGFDLEAGEEIVCDRCHQRQVREFSR
jgi:hypothetical protein